MCEVLRMSGARERAAFVKAHKTGEGLPADRFEYLSDRSGKVRCVICHRDGYGPVGPIRSTVAFDGSSMPWDRWISPWQLDCLQDHTWPCSCGRAFTRYVDLWRHIGADRPRGWGRQERHEMALFCEVSA